MIIKDENVKQILKDLGILESCLNSDDYYDHYEYIKVGDERRIWFCIRSYTDRSYDIYIKGLDIKISEENKKKIKKQLIKTCNEILRESDEVIQEQIKEHLRCSNLIKSMRSGS